MGNFYNGYSWQQREGILREEKRLRKTGDLEPLSYLVDKKSCEVCDDPGRAGQAFQWHSEDYSPPYSFRPPETFIICAVCHSRLHKRFPDASGKPSDWPLFVAHLKSGGYGREFTELYSLEERKAWLAQIKAGRTVSLPSLRERPLTGKEWWQTLTLDPESLIAPWARPRPWLPRPPPQDYRAELDQLQLTDDEIALLRCHAGLEHRCATMRQLAECVLSSKSPSHANLIYGKLAHRLAAALGWEPERRADGSPIWRTVIAEGWQPVGREFEWVMVPSLAAIYA
ncbi:MAG: hypothetical protein JSR42_17265 [Proteobacteria bacterium]|nr:hypothetical protein [Pseudomonadota bacterium]